MLISILLPDLRAGGVENVRLVLAREFERVGHEVEFVLTQASGELLGRARQTYSVVDLAAPRARHMAGPLAAYLDRRQPDAVLAAMWPLTVIAPFARRLARHHCPIVASEHNSLSIQYSGRSALHRHALRKSMAIGYRANTAVVAVSHGVAADLSALSGLAMEDIDVIHNPVPEPPTTANSADVEALWGTPSGSRILSVGTLKSQKNHALLIDAFARLPMSHARLMLVGTGKREDALRARAQELGVSERVIFAGFHADPRPFYTSADVFVLSSDYEGFGNVIIEALAAGTPVVSTDCPSGPAEILENGRYGRLVPVGDAIALSAGIADALNDTKRPEVLRARAAAFAPDVAAARYLECFAR
ncbi:MAG: glycosyltransferase [Pseudomonadota bacterium]